MQLELPLLGPGNPCDGHIAHILQAQLRPSMLYPCYYSFIPAGQSLSSHDRDLLNGGQRIK